MKRTISTRAASVGLAAALLASLVAPAAFASTTPAIPAAPSNPTATAVSATAIQVTWADNSNNETGFVVSDSLTSVTLGANTTSYTWGGLTAGTYKCFHVEAYNSAGASAWTGWACATTPTAAQGGQSKRLNVPFISQWNGTNGGGNCGPASLTMILSYYGKSVTFQQAVAAVRLGGPAAPGWTDFESANSVALLQNNGLTYVRTNGAVLNMGSLSAIKAQLDANRPVIMEVWNAYGQNTIYGGISGMVGDHIVVVTGYDATASGTIQTIYINDPLAVVRSSTGAWVADPREGYGKDYALSASDFISAASGGGWYGAAVQ